MLKQLLCMVDPSNQYIGYIRWLHQVRGIWKGPYIVLPPDKVLGVGEEFTGVLLYT